MAYSDSFAAHNMMEKEVGHAVHEVHEDPETVRKKLVLCFDGTSNQFQGNESDTNVVKLYQMFDRTDKHQYHYYQPGIGTYRANSALQNAPAAGFFARALSRARANADEGFATSFAEHVMAGYKFLMRYFMEDDKIYIFGFSRGAYTARFLCELIDEVGLLSKGNEEMVPFIWYQYLDARAHRDDVARQEKLQKMRQTFCRDKKRAKVYWLGLWDCVNSVAAFSGAPVIYKSNPDIAVHVRHAVSCQERRVMFKPTLFDASESRIGTTKQRWFAGNHGDVGGGWPLDERQGLLLSDIPLIWMADELLAVDQADSLPISLRSDAQNSGADTVVVSTLDTRRAKLAACMQRLQRRQCYQAEKLWHDVLTAARSKSLGMLPFWWLLEALPLKHSVLAVKREADWKTSVNEQGRTIKRKAISYDYRTTHMPNLGRNRNIPLDAIFDSSMQILHDAGVIKSMSRWAYGPVGYAALVKEETMVHGQALPSREHDRYMFIC